MVTTLEYADAAIKKQNAKPEATLSEVVDDAAKARERVAAISQQYGGPALDIGTGAYARLAVAMAGKGLKVTAVDHNSVAVAIAKWTAEELSDCLDVRYAEATRLPCPDGAYRVVTAFDALCHAAAPAGVLAEMFRVCAVGGAGIVTELNPAGRKIISHRGGGFEARLDELLAPHCQDCQQINHGYHVTYVCRKESHVGAREL